MKIRKTTWQRSEIGRKIRSKGGIPGRTDHKKDGRKTHVPLKEACKPANGAAMPQS
jgi:hypothetical protein